MQSGAVQLRVQIAVVEVQALVRFPSAERLGTTVLHTQAERLGTTVLHTQNFLKRSSLGVEFNFGAIGYVDPHMDVGSAAVVPHKRGAF